MRQRRTSSKKLKKTFNICSAVQEVASVLYDTKGVAWTKEQQKRIKQCDTNEVMQRSGRKSISNAKFITQIPRREVWKLKCCRQYLSTGIFPHAKDVSTFYVYGSVHHNIFHEITNRCSYMQSILFHCFVHSTCFGRFIHPSLGVQFQLCLQPRYKS